MKLRTSMTMRGSLPQQTVSPRFVPAVVTSARLDQLHNAAQATLAETIREFVRLDGKSVDPARWQLLKSRDGVSVFGDHLCTSSLLVAGTVRAHLDDVMEGLSADTSEGTRRVLHHLNPRFVDAEVLQILERGSLEHPFAFTGLKWAMVKSSTGMVSNRDICYFEKRGVVDIAGRRKLGYLLMQSADVPECPASPSRKIVRADVSLCYLFEELRDGVVGIYMKGKVESRGPRMLWKMARTSFADIVLSMGRAVEVAHAKRYTKLKHSKPLGVRHAKARAIACEVCRSVPSIFAHHYACAGCHKTNICKNCRTKCDTFDLDTNAAADMVPATFCLDCVKSVHFPMASTPSKPTATPPLQASQWDATQRLSRDQEPTTHGDDYDQDNSEDARFTACEYDSYANTSIGDDQFNNDLPDSQRSLRHFSLKLAQQLEHAGYNDTDVDLRLSDLEVLGNGELHPFEVDISDPVSIDVIGDGEQEDQDDDDEEVLSVRLLRRSTQPPEMLEKQQLNRDGSIRHRPQSQSDPERPSKKHEHNQLMLSRLVEATITAERTLELTNAQSKRANRMFATSRGYAGNPPEREARTLSN